MKITVLSSGSDGNATLVDCDGDLFLFDCGVSKMSKMNIDWDRVKGIFITHGHSDHISKLPSVLKVCDAPVYISKDEWYSDRVQKIVTTFTIAPKVIFVEPLQKIDFDTCYVTAYLAHHDTPLPLHYCITSKGKGFFYGSDCVDLEYHLVCVINYCCEVVMLDCNYDEYAYDSDEIDGNPILPEAIYPEDLKYRVRYQGHMSNQYVRDLFFDINTPDFIFIPAHLSKTYNSRDTIRNVFRKGDVRIAEEYPLVVSV